MCFTDEVDSQLQWTAACPVARAPASPATVQHGPVMGWLPSEGILLAAMAMLESLGILVLNLPSPE